jgi:hypothetical protein
MFRVVSCGPYDQTRSCPISGIRAGRRVLKVRASPRTPGAFPELDDPFAAVRDLSRVTNISHISSFPVSYHTGVTCYCEDSGALKRR